MRLVLALLLALVAASSLSAASRLLDIDLRAVVSRADLHYAEPATRSEEGMPVGNGRMGSLVWTTPDALKFQINRVDVFGCDAATVSFPEADSDYAGGCGYVDINLVDAGDDVFAGIRLHAASFRLRWRDDRAGQGSDGPRARLAAPRRHGGGDRRPTRATGGS